MNIKRHASRLISLFVILTLVLSTSLIGLAEESTYTAAENVSQSQVDESSGASTDDEILSPDQDAENSEESENIAIDDTDSEPVSDPGNDNDSEEIANDEEFGDSDSSDQDVTADTQQQEVTHVDDSVNPNEKVDIVEPEIYSTFKTDRYIIKYKNEFENSDIVYQLQGKIAGARKIKGNNKNRSFDVIQTNVRMKPEDFINEIKAMKADKNIEYIQPDYIMTAASNDPYFAIQWGLSPEVENQEEPKYVDDYYPEYVVREEDKPFISIGSNAVSAWEQTTGAGTIVAVIDTGIDITHEDLSENIWTNIYEIPGNGIDDDGNGYIDDVNGWNFTDNNNEVHRYDLAYDEWHGTHIAGIIAAVKDNEKGISGVAPSAKIMPLKVFKDGIAYTSDIIEAIEYAASMGAMIANCSWGTTEDNPALRETMAAAPILFVVASGNSHMNIDTNPVYPASYNLPNVIAVSAVNKSGKLTGFSNYGTMSVGIAAPGEDIVSTLPLNSYGQSNGTSMAAAYVSGGAALLLSKFQHTDSVELASRLLASSDKYSSLLQFIQQGNKIDCSNAVNEKSTMKYILSLKMKSILTITKVYR